MLWKCEFRIWSEKDSEKEKNQNLPQAPPQPLRTLRGCKRIHSWRRGSQPAGHETERKAIGVMNWGYQLLADNECEADEEAVAAKDTKAAVI
jgi:hypothetical protein